MKIPLLVFLSHLLFVGVLVYLQTPKITPPNKRSICIKTILLKENKIQPKPNSTLPVKSKEEVIPSLSRSELSKNEVKKNIQDEKPKINQTAPPKVNPANKQTKKSDTQKSDPSTEQLIALMQNSLNSLGSSNISENLPTPTQIETLSSETIEFQTNYQEELVFYLQSRLSLPEKGEVKLKVTVERNGRVEKVEILDAASEKNKLYVASALTSFSFPPFASQFKNEKRHTFTLCLTSEFSH